MKPTKRDIMIVEDFVKKTTKKIMNEANAYDRGSDQNLKKSMIKTAEFLMAWSEIIDKKNLVSSDFAHIKNEITKFNKELSLHSKNWDK